MKTIMIIDDDDLILKTTRLALEGAGYSVITAFSGEEGLEMLKTARPDLILLDIMMPGLDGWQTLQAIKGNNSTAEVPVMVFTVKELTDEELSKKEELDFADYIEKPFDYDNLLKKIQKTINVK